MISKSALKAKRKNDLIEELLDVYKKLETQPSVKEEKIVKEDTSVLITLIKERNSLRSSLLSVATMCKYLISETEKPGKNRINLPVSLKLKLKKTIELIQLKLDNLPHINPAMYKNAK